MFPLLPILLALFLFLGCSDTRPFLKKFRPDDTVQSGIPEERPNHSDVLTFYALGDWGTGKKEQKAVAEALKKDVEKIPSGRKVAPFVVGLGDNVYEIGLPAGWDNPETEKLLEKTFRVMYADIKYEGQNLIFHIIPGNHDYHGVAGGKKGYGDTIHQETTAERVYPFWEYYPINPEFNSDKDDSLNYVTLKELDIFRLTIPQKLPLSDQRISMIAIDTQVLLELYQKNDSENLQRHLAALEEHLEYDADWKFIIGHHPIKSHGKHGGFRTGIWWVPPIVLATIVDKLFVKRLQDLDNASNRRFQEDLKKIMDRHNVVFYISGHEHSLQLLDIAKGNFQVVSGSAAKLSPVTHKSDTIFSHSAHGFARFDVTEKELWVEFFAVDAKKGGVVSTAFFKIRK